MRELKYRVYDKIEKCYSAKAFSIDQLGICYVQDEDGYWEEIDEERYVVEPYTGLEDKKGKEIYKGDIVEVIGIDIAQVIDFPSGEWRLYYKLPKNKPSGLWEANTTSYIEVIGNIHENPELVKEKE